MSTSERPDPAANPPAEDAPLASAAQTPALDETRAPGPTQWETIAASAEFKALLRRKATFIAPTCVFFVVYYFALPILVGFFPALMKTRLGDINLAYAFALSQFFMVWGIAALYVRVAAQWDKQSAALIAAHSEAGK